MRFDLITLKLVLAIADTRSITRGAERENLALGAASRRLSDLEARLGVALFDRHARGVRPTEAGQTLLRHIRTLDASLQALEAEVADFARGLRGHLRVAANASAIAEHLPADLAAFAHAQPGVRVSLEELTSAEVQAEVAAGRADAGVFVAPQLEPRLDCRRYREGLLAVLVPRAHALARRKAVDFEALLDHDIVGLHVGAAAHEQMRERAQALGRPLAVRVQVHGFDAIAQLVEAGLGVAVLPATVAERFTRLFRVEAVGLSEAWARREYLLAVRPQDRQPLPLQRFIDTLCPASPATAAAVRRTRSTRG